MCAGRPGMLESLGYFGDAGLEKATVLAVKRRFGF
jgi:hypothetical protein